MVAGSRIMQAITNWQARMVSTAKLLDCSSQVKT